VRTLVGVMIGGSIGAGLRYPVGTWVPGVWTTVVINVLGCLALGFWLTWAGRRGQVSEGLRLMVSVGVLGGFTTYSTFGVEQVALWQSGAFGPALAVLITSLLGGVLAAGLGVRAGASAKSGGGDVG